MAVYVGREKESMYVVQPMARNYPCITHVPNDGCSWIFVSTRLCFIAHLR